MDFAAVIAALVAFVVVGVAGMIAGAAIVWFTRPPAAPMPALPVPAQPAVPIDPSLPEAMRAALAQAPDSFASARSAPDIRALMSCVVCKEGTALTCPTCGRRVCMAHKEPGDHPCSAG